MKKLKVCWLSAGVSSFMAGYLAGDVDEWIYIDIDDQHEDSMRFIKDIENVIGKDVKILRSEQYRTVEECVLAFGGFRNPHNSFAPCTNWLKKRVRKQWEEQHRDYELTYVWGFDLKEKDRAERTVEANPQAQHEFPLIEKNLSKEEVHGLFDRIFDFKRPLMYDLGYPNNNCIGCVKGGRCRRMIILENNSCIDIAALLIKAADCIRYAERISALHDCNDCGKVKTCEYLPRIGENTRINCPLWMGANENNRKRCD